MRSWFLLSVILMPAALSAAEPLRLASADPAPKRFFPISASKEQQNGITIIREKSPLPLRSDRVQRDNGFMRIDRARTVVIPAQHALPMSLAPARSSEGASIIKEDVLSQTPQATGVNDDDTDTESEEIIGNREGVDPVLVLFDAGDAGSLTSFSDAMRGRGNLSRAGQHAFWPIPLTAKQYVSSGYGMRADPFHGRQTFHGGIDIAADEGTAVLATADGSVLQVASDPRYGKYITLQHADGTLTRYGHLSGQSVREGQRVRGGQVIGAVGATGRATGAHLDYRVSKNGTKFDPLAILRVPSTVAFKGTQPSQPAVAMNTGARVASNSLPKRPMVIQVR